ncbi:MAG: threonine aldolase [Acidimicrobiia bacterium]|nr:threonine aldolase [Acidimicrobiia bacterium]
MNDFLSDNASGLCPEALEALRGASGGYQVGYGADEETGRAVGLFRELFGGGTEVFFVATGTAANILALASVTRPWERVLCEEYSHVASDESTGPERVTGCRVVTVAAEGRKLSPGDLERRDRGLPRGVHHPAPGAVSISNPTEFGEVYDPDELAALAEASHRLGYRLHVDGARLANAVARLGCAPRALAGDAGVDVLTFGGTKNGLALGEAVLFLPGPEAKEAAARFEYHRKGTGHLLSKHRFVSAPFAAVLEDGAWLRHAARANALAGRLAGGLTAAGMAPRFATEANGVFVPLPEPVRRGLAERGWAFHSPGHPDWGVARFMTSFDTAEARVDQLVRDAADSRAGAAGGAAT